MSSVASQKHGPEVLLIFLGHSSDADSLADAIYDLERDLQRLLDQHLRFPQKFHSRVSAYGNGEKTGCPSLADRTKWSLRRLSEQTLRSLFSKRG